MPLRVKDRMRDLYKLVFFDPLTPVIPAGAHQTTVRPFGGEKVHRTFSVSRLTSLGERGSVVAGDYRYYLSQPWGLFLAAGAALGMAIPSVSMRLRVSWSKNRVTRCRIVLLSWEANR
jgi:hypothetical protein